MIIDRIDSVEKPLAVQCFHHFSGSTYVGAVWLETPELGGKWKAQHSASKERYGILGEFDSRTTAMEALEKSLEGL